MKKYYPKFRVRTFAHCFAVCAAIVLFVMNILAQTPDAPDSLKNALVFITLAAAVFTILGNVAWSFFNRRGYDKLRETIADMKEVDTAKNSRMENMRLTHAEEKARLELKINVLTTSVTNLSVSNEAICEQNLQAKAILKDLRLAGKWEGHEDRLFQVKE